MTKSGAALEDGFPLLWPHDLFLLLVSVAFVPCQVEFRAAGIESFLPARHDAACCRGFRDVGSAASGLSAFRSLGAMRQLRRQPWREAVGLPGRARSWPGGGPRGSADRHTARLSQFLVLIGQAYFIKRSLVIYNY